MNAKGQILIVVAIFLLVVLFFLAVIIDGARLMVEKHELDRAADAAARAGIGLVGDQMVTQVIQAQTQAAIQLCTPVPTQLPEGQENQPALPTCTPTPSPKDFYAWLNESHRATLVSPNMQTAVAEQVSSLADMNGLGYANPHILELEIEYPHQYNPGEQDLNIYVRIQRRVTVLFSSLLGLDEGELSGDTQQSIPVRR